MEGRRREGYEGTRRRDAGGETQEEREGKVGDKRAGDGMGVERDLDPGAGSAPDREVSLKAGRRRVLRPEDLYRFRNAGGAQVSPDGSKVLFAVSQADQKSDRNQTNIWLADVSTREVRRFTSSGKDRLPRWSPDGRRFAFVSDRSGKAQIWIAEMDGGEPWHLRTDQAVRGAPVWSPNGEHIVFTSRDFAKDDGWIPYPGAPEWDRRRAEGQALKALAGRNDKNEKERDAGRNRASDRERDSGKERDGRRGQDGQKGLDERQDVESDVKVITRLQYRFDGAGYPGDLSTHVYIVAVPGSAPESPEVAGVVRRLTHGDYNHQDAAFSPDGKYLVVPVLRREDADYLQKQDFWLVEVATGRMVQLMDGVGPARAPTWSPDGENLAFLGHDRSHLGSTTEAIWVLEVGSFVRDLEGREGLSEPEPLSMAAAANLTRGLDRPIGNRASSDMRYDGGLRPFFWEDRETIVFLACDKGATGVFRVRLGGAGACDAERQAGAEPGPGAESGSGAESRSGAGCGVARGPESVPVIERIWHDPNRTVSNISQAGGAGGAGGASGTTVLQIGSPTEPDSLYLFDPDADPGKELTRLTNFNDWLSDFALGTCERLTYKGDKGWDIDGWLLYPAGRAGRVGDTCHAACQDGCSRECHEAEAEAQAEAEAGNYPTVLFIHGGPHGVYGSSFMFQCQIFAGRGYAVLYTNPRGSQSYGQEFAYACVQDWGGADFRDIMAGVDHVVSMGVADPSRLFVTGWSYGGYMTSWTITQTNRFKAAVAGAIVSNRYSMWGTSDIPSFGEHQWGGLPWEAHEHYFERSAISYVPRVETPVMFIHGEGDFRCPISQSEELYLALKRLGKTAVFVRYPGEFHGFSKPRHKFDRFERMLSWFDYHASQQADG